MWDLLRRGSLVNLESHPNLAALDTLVGAVEHQTGAQQVGAALHTVAVCVQASVREAQRCRSRVSPVVPERLLSQSPVCVQSRVVSAPVSVKGHRRRPSVQLHAGVEALRPQHRGRVAAAPVVRPEGDGERPTLLRQRGEGFLRVDCRGEGMKL